MSTARHDAVAVADDVRQGRITALARAETALAAVAAGDPGINSFTTVLTDRALGDAARVDELVTRGEDPGPLAGVPFAVKNLFDVAGLTTLAGSAINRDLPPATADAEAVARLTAAGAVLVGALNMDEYAYGFTTENSHYGPCHNPHDPARVAGGSSGGSAAAVAAGLVPLTLGSDTNGSVRVPAALCGVFGLKPTFGRVSRAGMELFAASFDHVGALATSARDLAVAFDALQDGDPVAPGLGGDVGGLRIAVGAGHFARGGEPAVFEATERIAAALGVTRRVEIPEATRARSAAMVITAAEGAERHLASLRRRAAEFDPMTRDRFLAGALVPASAYVGAQRFREWYRSRVSQLFDTVDVVLAPTVPFAAPLIGQRDAVVDGEAVLTQPYLGVYTQPLSCVGLPVVSVPVPGPAGLPLGVQVVAAPGADGVALRVAHALETMGAVGAVMPVASPGGGGSWR